MRNILAALAMVFISTSLGLAQNAEIKIAPMEIRILRGAIEGCSNECPEWISAQGQIQADTPRKLQKVIASLKGRKLPVLIHSNGGHVDAGIAMGRMIRQAGLVSAVAISPLPPACKPHDAACLRDRRSIKESGSFNLKKGLCASACTFMLAGGVRRVIHPEALVGVHQVTVTRTHRQTYRRYRVQWKVVNGRRVEVSRRLISERIVSERTYKLKSTPDTVTRKLERHFNAMGLAPAFLEKTNATSADTIYYLLPVEKSSHLIATHTSDFLIALGLYPTERHMAVYKLRNAYINFKPMGPVNTVDSVMEFSAYANPTEEKSALSIRVLQADQPIDASGLKLRIWFFGLVKAADINTDGDRNGVFRVNLSNAQFCGIRTSGTVLMTLSENGAEAVGPRWTKYGTVKDLMPLEGLQDMRCSNDGWTRQLHPEDLS